MIACFVCGPLRRVGFVLGTPERRLLVALLRPHGTLFVVERELFLADIRLDRAHLIARLAKAVIDEEGAVAIVLRHGITIVVLRPTPVELLLPYVEVALRRGGGIGTVGNRSEGTGRRPRRLRLRSNR
ncbi:hypothetical protein JCM10599A_32530 [Paraburkholderia kururiensis]